VAIVDGLLLAAGAGTRMGRPKALVVGDDGTPWLHASLQRLQEGGCRRVTVVLGAEAEEAAVLLARAPVAHEDVHVVVAGDWAEGMGASLRAGLAVLDRGADAVVVSLVDLPDVSAEVVRRVVAAADGPASLARATYDGRPGHPVLLGRDHWDGVLATASGDKGARDYLAAHEVAALECGDLATGRDVDTRAQTAGWTIGEPTVDDADELGRVHVAIWRRAYDGLMSTEYLAGLDPKAFAEKWRRRVADPLPGIVRLVARDEQGIVGFTTAGPPRIDDAPAELELYAINLLPRAQGTGLADELLDRTIGDHATYLWVIEGNERAQTFYRRRGFVDDGARDIDGESGAAEIRMVRRRRD
jgi:CTP:molybdopterin cytidylyltransferase MocA/ribosomal protein S18 acetylase RimI-like enzyme